MSTPARSERRAFSMPRVLQPLKSLVKSQGGQEGTLAHLHDNGFANLSHEDIAAMLNQKKPAKPRKRVSVQHAASSPAADASPPTSMSPPEPAASVGSPNDEAAAAAEKGLPNGWRVVEHATESGRSIRTFLSPANTKHRSLKSALAAAVDGPPASPIAKKQAKKLAKKK